MNLLGIFAFLTVITIVTPISAIAAFRSELFVGGSSGGQMVYKKTGTTYTMANSGVPAGLFLGYRSGGGFFTGLEYTYIGLGFSDGKAPATHPDISTSQQYAGLKLGYEGNRIRIFASYLPMNTFTFYRKASTQTNTPDVFKGSSVSAGLGLNMGARWALDLVYYTDTFTTFDFGSSKNQNITGSSTFNNVTNNNIALNIVFKMSGMK